MNTKHTLNSSQSMTLLLAGAIGVSVAGFVLGVRQGEPTSEVGMRRHDATAVQRADGVAQAEAARSYSELARHPWGRQSSSASLAKAIFDKSRPEVANPPGRDVVLAQRETRRAYDGAPPMIPHGIGQRNLPDCLACHGKGAVMPAGMVAPVMSHREFLSCTQCHAVADANLPVDTRLAQPIAANTFAALALPLAGERAWDGAPPLMPHDASMRDNCLACHGSLAEPALRTSHPERVQCLQCHALPVENVAQTPLSKNSRFP